MARKPNEIVKFLLTQHVITPADLVDTDLSLSGDVRDRFVLSALSIDGCPRFMVKRARYADSIESIRQELRVYRCLGSKVELAFVSPVLVAEDFQQGLLVSTWVGNGINDNNLIPQEEMAMRLGIGIGRLHANTKETMSEVGSPGRPWVLSSLSSRPKWLLQEIDIICARLDQEEVDILARRLQHGLKSWQADSLIHGDLKREHNLVDSSHNGGPICLIDWELAGYGDTAWDVASIISDIMFDNQYSCGPEVDHAQHVVQTEEVAIFLRNYAHECPMDHKFLKRVSLYTGARLFQICLESASAYGVSDESGVDILLAMAVDVFRDPFGFSAALDHPGLQ